MNETKVKTVFEERAEAMRSVSRLNRENEQLKTDLGYSQKLNEALNRENAQQFTECNQLRAQLAATEEALAQVQRESAELREKYAAALDTIKTATDLVNQGKAEVRAITNQIEGEIAALAEPSDVDEKEDGLGFFPGFSPGFDVKRAEKGLAQEVAHCEPRIGQD